MCNRHGNPSAGLQLPSFVAAAGGHGQLRLSVVEPTTKPNRPTQFQRPCPNKASYECRETKSYQLILLINIKRVNRNETGLLSTRQPRATLQTCLASQRRRR